MPDLAWGSGKNCCRGGENCAGSGITFAGLPECAGSRDPSRSGNVIAAACQSGAPGQVGRQTAGLGSKDLPVGARVALE